MRTVKGFVCPTWAYGYWNPRECTIEECTDGSYVVLDHSIQTTVYEGGSRKECVDFLRENGGC